MIPKHNFRVLTFILIFINTSTLCSFKPLESEIESDNHECENEILENNISQEDSEYRSFYAKQMLSYMNQSVDPCEDFYEYSCGNWKHVIEEKLTVNKRNNLFDISYKLSKAMADILERPFNSFGAMYESEFKLAQTFYNSCLETNLLTPINSSDYMEVINKIGGFPALDDSWCSTNFSWFNMSAHLTNYGAVGLINEEIHPIYPFPPNLKLPELGLGFIVHSDNIATNASGGYIFNEKQMRKYLTAYGVQEPKISEVILGVFEFWKAAVKLAEVFHDDAYKCKGLEQKVDFANFTQWDNYFDIAWKGNNFNLTADDLPCHYYYIKLDKICESHKHAVANYLALAFLHKMDSGLKSQKNQKEYCISEAVHMAPYIMDELYLKEYFNTKIHDEVVTILKEVKQSLLSTLKNADWLDEATRTEALLKESTLDYRIGKFQDKNLTDTLIGEMKILTLHEDNYELNNINANKFKTFLRRYLGLHFELFNNQTKPLELLIGAQVNAFYYVIDNSINIMAGILHPPAFHTSWPNSLKFGTLGYLIGHEFTHGFDSSGSTYDSMGIERYWWSNKSGIVFDERADCYAKHFDTYLIPEINRHVNGMATQDENIADNGGLREALDAYRTFIKKESREKGHKITLVSEQMPEIDLSPEQLFFLGFSQLWCASYKEEHFWQELVNEHTIDKYRVLGAVTNYEEFAKVFECPLGSKMNPKEDKCRVW